MDWFSNNEPEPRKTKQTHGSKENLEKKKATFNSFFEVDPASSSSDLYTIQYWFLVSKTNLITAFSLSLLVLWIDFN